MAAVNSYLNFNGNCAEVFEFYKSVFGTEYESVMRFGDVPVDNPTTQEEKDMIMHISLPIGKGTYIFGSDVPAHMGKVTPGNNFNIAIAPDSEEEAKKLFDGLSAGGQVTMPLEKTFWNAYFGMFTDKFGISWMVNYQL